LQISPANFGKVKLVLNSQRKITVALLGAWNNAQNRKDEEFLHPLK